MNFKEWELQAYCKNTGKLRIVLIGSMMVPFLIMSYYYGNYGMFFALLGYMLSYMLYSIAGLDREFSRSLREVHARIISMISLILFTVVFVIKI